MNFKFKKFDLIEFFNFILIIFIIEIGFKNKSSKSTTNFSFLLGNLGEEKFRRFLMGVHMSDQNLRLIIFVELLDKFSKITSLK